MQKFNKGNLYCNIHTCFATKRQLHDGISRMKSDKVTLTLMDKKAYGDKVQLSEVKMMRGISAKECNGNVRKIIVEYDNEADGIKENELKIGFFKSENNPIYAAEWRNDLWVIDNPRVCEFVKLMEGITKKDLITFEKTFFGPK